MARKDIFKELEEETKPDYINVILAFGLLILIVISVITLIVVRGQGAKCLANPAQTAVDKLSEQSGEDVIAIFTSKSYSATYMSCSKEDKVSKTCQAPKEN